MHHCALLSEFAQSFYYDSNFNVTAVVTLRTIHAPRSTLCNVLFLCAIYVIITYALQCHATIFHSVI